jgi:F-type H+-transporting ATPase subunit delta
VPDLLDRIFGRDDRVRGYATALVAVADAEGVLDRVADELFAFAKEVERDDKLRDAITDKALPLENRRDLIRDILGGRAHDVTVTEVSFLIESGRARDIGKIADGVVALAAERREQAVAEVRSAVPLSDAQRKRLEQALSRATGRTIEAKVVVDPTVVGGVFARVGDLVFDGSIAGRLEDAKQALGS